MQRYCDIDAGALRDLLARFGLQVRLAPLRSPVPGSYWGGPEAGLRGAKLYLRPDTPLHSVLHEAAHFVCASPARRAVLDTDAGGDDLEECAVCYLQVKLAEVLPGVGQARMFAAMDAWGYSFRLGSARRWFVADAADARAWLLAENLLGEDETPTWRVRACESTRSTSADGRRPC